MNIDIRVVGTLNQLFIGASQTEIIFSKKRSYPVDTRRRFNVYKTSIRRRQGRIDVL